MLWSRYVIDSIVRAASKLPENVYAERFAMHIHDTFWNIFEAPTEDHVCISLYCGAWTHRRYNNRILRLRLRLRLLLLLLVIFVPFSVQYQ
jgi:hypothetical protein